MLLCPVFSLPFQTVSLPCRTVNFRKLWLNVIMLSIIICCHSLYSVTPWSDGPSPCPSKGLRTALHHTLLPGLWETLHVINRKRKGLNWTFSGHFQVKSYSWGLAVKSKNHSHSQSYSQSLGIDFIKWNLYMFLWWLYRIYFYWLSFCGKNTQNQNRAVLFYHFWKMYPMYLQWLFKSSYTTEMTKAHPLLALYSQTFNFFCYLGLWRLWHLSHYAL